MPPLVLRTGHVIDPGELRWRFSRAGGPGGQGVNTTDSRVELSFDLARTTALPPELRERAVGRLRRRLTNGVLTVVATEHRSQLRNREAATERLVEMLDDALRPPPPPRRPTRASRASRARRRATEQHRRQIKALRRTPPRHRPE